MRARALLTAAAVIVPWLVPPSSAAEERRPAKPETVFFDDFSKPELDRSRWNVRVTGRTVNNEQQAYVDSAETISIARGKDAEGASGGALLLQARHRPGFATPEGRKFDFVSGRIDTREKVTFTHGTAAARMKLPAGAGLWPAFWALGSGRWPDCGEIDVMEYVGDPKWTSVAIHGRGYSGNTPIAQRAPFPDGEDATRWHVYAVDWTPEGFVFKVDDRVVYRATREMIEKHGKWAFDDAKYLILNLALGGAYPAGVNKVKSPYPGIPESTVDLIKAGKARVLVDWVRITKG
jgi:beta-glucanase (GH16 family)